MRFPRRPAPVVTLERLARLVVVDRGGVLVARAMLLMAPIGRRWGLRLVRGDDAPGYMCGLYPSRHA